ncbi:MULTISPECIES: transporter substrate-binding domain-containing protein [unclassified Diaminobutyricimonas]|uniref:transporter substrate-binding domain-containing protein n=1 Tax=unclassified Diaminobutyricimonas TaxID=2643261 RepID=UPI0012F5240A|nr:MULTISPECIES: transporter substrate-binding domain-containing protein [unclassified Diaminobutyricimonas]
MSRLHHRIAAAIIMAAVPLLTGCGTIPTDPDGTFDRVSGGTLRVGVSLNSPWTEQVTEDQFEGTEVALVERFADELDAEIQWTMAGEEALIRRLEHDQLDLVIGGLTDQTPWIDKAAITRPYAETSDEHGTRKHVMAVPMGENRFLVELETFLLDGEEGS